MIWILASLFLEHSVYAVSIETRQFTVSQVVVMCTLNRCIHLDQYTCNEYRKLSGCQLCANHQYYIVSRQWATCIKQTRTHAVNCKLEHTECHKNTSLCTLHTAVKQKNVNSNVTEQEVIPASWRHLYQTAVKHIVPGKHIPDLYTYDICQ